MSTRGTHLKEIWIVFFLLGVTMLNYPFIHIFNKNLLVAGFPLLFLYFMLGWPISILVVYIFSRNMHKDGDDESSDQDEEVSG
ncbi:MAG: hypothetical protein WDA20_07225 [Desulfuromonadales bacterium]|jgi:hypothetical protein